MNHIFNAFEVTGPPLPKIPGKTLIRIRFARIIGQIQSFKYLPYSTWDTLNRTPTRRAFRGCDVKYTVMETFHAVLISMADEHHA
jgi:hypothetical protein